MEMGIQIPLHKLCGFKVEQLSDVLMDALELQYSMLFVRPRSSYTKANVLDFVRSLFEYDVSDNKEQLINLYQNISCYMETTQQLEEMLKSTPNPFERLMYRLKLWLLQQKSVSAENVIEMSYHLDFQQTKIQEEKLLALLKKKILTHEMVKRCFAVREIVNLQPQNWPDEKLLEKTPAPYLETLVQKAVVKGYSDSEILNCWTMMLAFRSNGIPFPESDEEIELDMAFYVLFYSADIDIILAHSAGLKELLKGL